LSNPYYQEWYNQLAYRIQALSSNPDVGRSMFGTNFTGTLANIGTGIYGGNTPLPTDTSRIYDRQNPRGNADYYRDTFGSLDDFYGAQRMTRTSLRDGLPGQRQQGPVRTSQRRR
jgi:hypothetical protein